MALGDITKGGFFQLFKEKIKQTPSMDGSEMFNPVSVHEAVQGGRVSLPAVNSCDSQCANLTQ